MSAFRIVDPEVRREQITLRVNEALKVRSVRKEYKFRNGAELPVIELPVDHLIYRLENYRTRDKQLSYEATGKTPKGFFDPSRREDPSVQLKQHEILLVQAKTGSGETIKPIYDELARVAEQTDELIVSADGVVVNGNRRLCAMRGLLTEDSNRYKRFETVRCAVLPASTTDKEIRSLEIGLQMQPDTKLPYEWTALGRAVRDLREMGDSDEEIALGMNRSKIEIQRAAKMVDAAEMYLETWLDDPEDFDKLDGTEQAFIQIATRNFGKVDNPSQREVTRKFDFFLVENRSQVTDRVYTLINVIETNPEAFLSSMAKELRLEVTPARNQAIQKPKISFDDGGPTGALDFSPLVEQLIAARKDPEKAGSTVKLIESVCETVAEQGKNRDKAALKFSLNAEKALLAVDLQSAAPTTYREIDTILSRCIELSEKLKAEISRRTTRD